MSDHDTWNMLPCPFCGSAGKMIRPMGERVYNKDENGKAVPPFYGPDWFRVVCTGDDCHCMVAARPDAETALATWNRRSAPEPTPPQPDDDGWIKWEGGECPTWHRAIVEVRFRDGGIACRQASSWAWGRWGGPSDIVAYRIVSEAGVTK